MDLTVESLRNAKFREGWRGYNPQDVDEFIDHVAEGVQALQDRVAELRLRAERAEARPGSENDETMKRTLVLAQQAADLVVSEARAAADRIVADAHHDAGRVVAEAAATAEVRRQQLGAEIVREGEARREAIELDHQHKLARLSAERDAMQRDRDRLSAEVGELRAHALSARDRLRAVLTDQLVRIDALTAEHDRVRHDAPMAVVAPGVVAPAVVAERGSTERLWPQADLTKGPTQLEGATLVEEGGAPRVPAVAVPPADPVLARPERTIPGLPPGLNVTDGTEVPEVPALTSLLNPGVDPLA